MANGFSGTKEKWDMLESLLEKLDADLEEFVKLHRVRLYRSNGNWPDRRLEWGGILSRLIQIYLDDENKPSFNLWICLSEDREGRRYWKQEFLKKSVTIEEIETDLPNLLERAMKRMEGWSRDDLEFGTTLGA